MLNCQPAALNFSEHVAAKRIKAAQRVMNEKVIMRLIAIALFLCGAKREQIAQSIGMPIGTLLSLLHRFMQIGFRAITDRRRPDNIIHPVVSSPKPGTVEEVETNLCITMGDGHQVTVSRRNMLQCKVIILTLMNSGIVTISDASEVLGLSTRRTRSLGNLLDHDDCDAIFDKRRGQQRDYRFTPEVKAALVSQFVAHIVTNRSTSSAAIADELKKIECSRHMSDRSIREHIAKMGLRTVGRLLPQLIQELKKTP